MSLMCIVFFFIPGPRAGGRFENFNDALQQLANNTTIAGAIGGMICSIAFFNFSGVSVTKEMSATTRMVLDSIRTITIWAYGLGGQLGSGCWARKLRLGLRLKEYRTRL